MDDTGKCFITSIAVQGNGHVAPGEFAHGERGNSRRIGERLVVVPGKPGDQCRRIRSHDEFFVVGFEVLRDRTGER